VGPVGLGFGPDGRRRRRKVYGTTKTAVYDKLRELHRDLNKGVAPKADYRVGDCLDHGRNRVSGSDPGYRAAPGRESGPALSRADLINDRHGNRALQTRNLLRRGQAHHALGHHRRAVNYLAASLPIFGELQLPQWESQARNALILSRAAGGWPPGVANLELPDCPVKSQGVLRSRRAQEKAVTVKWPNPRFM
jgi:hypothetical protein